MDKGKLSTGANLLRLSTLGINFSLSFFAGLGMGWGVKKLFHTGDWVIFVGMLVGIVGSYFLLIGDLKSLQPPKRNQPDDKEG